MRVFSVGGLLLCGLLASAHTLATTLSLPEPGYLVIDGSYYGYGNRPAGTPASTGKLTALGVDGFHFNTALDLGNCSRADGAPVSGAAPGAPRFRYSDTPTPPEQPGLGFASLLPGELASLTLVACNSATLLLLRSADSDTVCTQRIAFPLQRGACPALDARDPGFVFFNAFE